MNWDFRGFVSVSGYDSGSGRPHEFEVHVSAYHRDMVSFLKNGDPGYPEEGDTEVLAVFLLRKNKAGQWRRRKLSTEFVDALMSRIIFLESVGEAINNARMERMAARA